MNITVYCGASQGNHPVYTEVAVSLGKWIAQNKYTLVYGGGKAGLMGVLSTTVLKNHGKVIGIMPKFLKERELAQDDLTELHIVDTMSERKEMMCTYGDAFIALPGGPGTLEEITEMISWTRIGQNPNPCIVFNANHYYDFLKKLYEEMVSEGFLTEEDRKRILFTQSLSKIETFMKSYQAPKPRHYE